mmetsp:Transcript_35726/g.78030  ORF Transcript_35726/g.78030 Transcript_35726/m.78030 type:complete len:121 (+) Transcript_35726:56-418(+)
MAILCLTCFEEAQCCEYCPRCGEMDDWEEVDASDDEDSHACGVDKSDDGDVSRVEEDTTSDDGDSSVVEEDTTSDDGDLLVVRSAECADMSEDFLLAGLNVSETWSCLQDTADCQPCRSW